MLKAGCAGLAERVYGGAALLMAGVRSGPEISLEQEEAVRCLASAVVERGEDWSLVSLRRVVDGNADLLFPGGVVELISVWAAVRDRDMIAAMSDVEEPRLSRRVRMAILLRLAEAPGLRDAERKAVSVLAAHGKGLAGGRIVARTVDAIWQAAGDHASGFPWFTKRITLTGVYLSVFLFWLARGEDREAVEAFLDRRLKEVLSLSRFRHPLRSVVPSHPVDA